MNFKPVKRNACTVSAKNVFSAIKDTHLPSIRNCLSISFLIMGQVIICLALNVIELLIKSMAFCTAINHAYRPYV